MKVIKGITKYLWIRQTPTILRASHCRGKALSIPKYKTCCLLVIVKTTTCIMSNSITLFQFWYHLRMRQLL